MPTQPVVVAESRKPGRPLVLGDDIRRIPIVEVPVGIRHVFRPNADDHKSVTVAVCGQPLVGWSVFSEMPFTGRDPADCRRCEQLTRADRSQP